MNVTPFDSLAHPKPRSRRGRSSRFSRSSAFTRCCSSVGSPGRRPVSRSARRTQRRRPSAVQPTFSGDLPYGRPLQRILRRVLLHQPHRQLLHLRGIPWTLSTAPASHAGEPPTIPWRFTCACTSCGAATSLVRPEMMSSRGKAHCSASRCEVDARVLDQPSHLCATHA